MKLKLTLMVIALSASFAAPAFAGEEPIAALPHFTAADTQLMFEENAMPMQLAALTPQEMKETEGAHPIIGVVNGAFANAPRLAQAGINFANAGAQPGAGKVASLAYNHGTSRPSQHTNPAAYYAAINSIPR